MSGFFKWALDYVLRNEGGFVDDPADAGGATNMGVTLETLREAWGIPGATVDDIRNLSVDDASPIYETRYWRPLNLGDLKQPAIATAILDAGVLFGVSESAKTAQVALNDSGMNLEEDGIIGPDTIRALNAVRPAPFLGFFVSRLDWVIGRIVTIRPEDVKFRSGWESRTKRYLTLA